MTVSQRGTGFVLYLRGSKQAKPIFDDFRSSQKLQEFISRLIR